MNTQEIMQLSLDMAGFSEVPGDSAIYHSGENLKKALIGIDLDAPELIYAKDAGYDLVISHHPKGGDSTLNFPKVLDRHTEMMIEHGVPKAVAEETMAEMIYDAKCRAQIANYDHAPSIARLINMPYMNIHLALDEVGRKMMVQSVEKLSATSTNQELVNQLKSDWGEFRNAKTDIDIRMGAPDNAIGKVVVAHACGTNGGSKVAKAYFDHGVDTVIYIHCIGPESRKLKEEFESKGKNLIITGHISSDSLGINPFIAELEDRGMQVTPVSGIIPA
jgi:hypothetical protein